MCELGFFSGFLFGGLIGGLFALLCGYIMIKRKIASIAANVVSTAKDLAVDHAKSAVLDLASNAIKRKQTGKNPQK